MSANNYLLIKDIDPNKGYYELTHRDADTGESFGEGFIISPDLKQVIKKAQEYMKENPVEYGIHFDI